MWSEHGEGQGKVPVFAHLVIAQIMMQMQKDKPRTCTKGRSLLSSVFPPWLFCCLGFMRNVKRQCLWDRSILNHHKVDVWFDSRITHRCPTNVENLDLLWMLYFILRSLKRCTWLKNAIIIIKERYVWPIDVCCDYFCIENYSRINTIIKFMFEQKSCVNGYNLIKL